MCSISLSIVVANLSAFTSSSGATSIALALMFGLSLPNDLTIPCAPAPRELKRYPPFPCRPSSAEIEHTIPSLRLANFASIC